MPAELYHAIIFPGGFMHPNFPRVPLASLPTPVEPLSRLSGALGGPRIFVKRDDLTGLAGGGNKARKLEFLVGEATAGGFDTLVTIGAPQSNHCRQTAAAAARCNLRCFLVLRGNPQPESTGNLLLDRLLGARIVWSKERSRETVMGEIMEAERAAGHKPYPIPLGGSNGLGAVGYALAMEEFPDRPLKEFSRIIFASSSGGTHAGMVVGAERTGYKGEVLGISIDEPLDDLQCMVAEIANDTSRRLGGNATFDPARILACADYLGEGYGILGAPEREAIELFARLEGILLDPVYTGRAAAGMIGLIRRGVIRKDETVLFWHTGGVPALWAYAEDLISERQSPGLAARPANELEKGTRTPAP
jgi:D-cysteine desulfhydrase family pyridoxal phosphate-dependent enzyme